MEKLSYSLDKNSNTGMLLWLSANKWQRELNKVLLKHSLTHVQFFLLTGLYELKLAKKHTTQMTLSTHAGIDKMMTSKVIRSLEEKKLVKRTVDKVDKRAIQLELTSFGTQLLKKAAVSASKFDLAYFKVLADKQKSLNKKLNRLIEEAK